MISINLLPPEFRAVEKKPSAYLKYIKIGIGVAGLLALMTIWFYIDFLLSSGKLNKLQDSWKVVEPQAQVLNALQNEVDGLKREHDFLAAFVATDKPVTFLLTWISAELPETCWLTENQLRLESNKSTFLVKGLCVPSKEVSSIGHIETYLHELKKKITDSNLSLQTSRVVKEGVELTRFVAIFDWKAVDES